MQLFLSSSFISSVTNNEELINPAIIGLRKAYQDQTLTVEDDEDDVTSTQAGKLSK